MNPASHRHFEDVYREHAPDLLRVVRHGFGLARPGAGARLYHTRPSAADAEDIVQESFRRLFESFVSGRFDPERAVRPYLMRIALNVSLTRHAKGRREPCGLPFEPPGPPAPHEAMECGRLLRRFKASLSARDQAVMSAYFEEDADSQAAVGATLGLSRDQVSRSVRDIRSQAEDFFGAHGWRDEVRVGLAA